MRRDMLSEAIALATRAHASQLDKAGAPYIGHPQRVARSVAAAGGSETAQVVAYLHDVVEDTAWTFDELRTAGFSNEVVTAIDALTRQEDESYVEFVARAGSNPIARLVKLADLADNLDPARIKDVVIVLDPLEGISPYTEPERYAAASAKADATWRDLERIDRYRSAWIALAGSEFPHGAPFPLAHAASTQTMLETLPDSGRVPGDQPTAAPDKHREGGAMMDFRYYEITDLRGARTGIFRHSKGTIERWNPATRAWDFDPPLYAYIYNGEVGAEPITEAQAMTITGATVERPSNSNPPVRQPLRLQLLPGHLAQDPKAVAAFVEAIRADGREMDEAAKSARGKDSSNAAAAPDKAQGFKVVLSTMERGRNERTQVTARIRPDGDLEVEYYTAGDEVLRDTGDSDYEHYTTVSWRKLPALVHLLREELGRPLPREIAPPRAEEILGLVEARFGGRETPSSDFEQWLREKRILYEAFTC